MRILHVHTSLDTGGAEKLMVDLLPRLRERGHDVELLVFDGTETPFMRAVRATGIKVHSMSVGGSVYSPKRLLQLIPYMRKFDVVHTHNTSPQLYAAIGSLVSKATLFTTEHNTNNRRRSWPLFKVIDRWMYNRYKRVICVSQKTEDNLRQYIGSSKAQISTINNGVDVSKYANALASGDLEKSAPASRKLLMVAAFRWEKDQDTIIRALNYLPETFNLFLVGKGVREPELKALAKSEGVEARVHFMGVRSDVPELLHAADYIVMSSHLEGLSLSSVEGMSACKPFIASNVDGLREIVKGAGILFEHGNAQALANEILRLETNPELRTQTANACANRARQYDINTMADAYAKLYTELNHEKQ